MLSFAAAVAAPFVVAIVVNAIAYNARAQALRSLRPCDRPEELSWPHTIVAFLRECIASVAAVALWPFAWTHTESIDPDAERAVILIHDLGLNAGAFAMLRHRLQRDGWQTVIAMRHSATLTDAASIAAQLHATISALATTSTRQVALVGHGFGGLVARFYARRYPASIVRRILTLGTPHQGSLLRRGRAGDLLQPGGELLTQLREADRLPQELDVIALHSTFDAKVLPPANAEYPRAFNIKLDDAGHDTLLFSRKVYDLIAENLAAPLH